MQQSYEKRISELQQIPLQKISTISLSAKSDEPYYDVFVSHAWEDKESFVDEFVNAFNQIINSDFNSGDIFRIDIKGDSLWVEKM